jgi:hypothetical protein
MAKKAHGNTATGVPITDELIDKRAAKRRLAMTSRRRYADMVGGHLSARRLPAWSRYASNR